MLPIELGGATTDTDVALGRVQSERIYHIVHVDNTCDNSFPNRTNNFTYSFSDANGSPRGLDNNDGTWLLTPADLTSANGGLHSYTPQGSNGTLMMQLTTVAVESDFDLAVNSTSFNVTVIPGPPGLGPDVRIVPLAPLLDVGDNTALEDGDIALNMTAKADANDTSSPNIAVVISDIPTGVEIKGSTLNVVTGNCVATAAQVAAGVVQITSPKAFSGALNITVEAVATSVYALSTKSEKRTVSLHFDPVADGVGISLPLNSGLEDEAIALSISLVELDVDGSETIQEFAYIQVDYGATLVALTWKRRQ